MLDASANWTNAVRMNRLLATLLCLTAMARADAAAIGMSGLEMELDDKGSIDSKRSVYFLYPNIMEEDAEYQLVFDKPGYRKAGYGLFKKLDEGRFILRKI